MAFRRTGIVTPRLHLQCAAGSTTILHMERLERTKRRQDGCLIWQGPPQPNGYGCLKVNGRKIDVHRHAYMLAYGDIPSGLCVCHTCDVRLCVEPTHLFLGTRGDNNRDMATKGRARTVNSGKTHCINGHEFSSSNTIQTTVVRSGKHRSGRKCRTCQNNVNREWMRKYRETGCR